MALIEQAVFTSAETERMAGYQLVARSPGVCEGDARALAAWGPSHDSLWEAGPEAASINFHPLPSGAYCVSRTTAAGFEYSGRGGHRIYTQCLVVLPEDLARFANNPFALMRAAMAAGAIEVHDDLPSCLPPISLAGRASAVDQLLLARLGVEPGARKMAALVQAALGSRCLAIAGDSVHAAAIAGLMSCLSPACRCEFSFATGLKFSSRRPFRVLAASDDPAANRWLALQAGVTVLDLAAEAFPPPTDSWAQLIERTLATGRNSFLAAELARHHDVRPADLPALGLQLIEAFEATSLRRRADDRLPDHGHGVVEPAAAAGLADPKPRDGNAASDVPLLAEASAGTVGRQQAHAAHRQFGQSRSAPAGARPASPARALAPDAPEVLERLEHLDDVVFEAIGGRAAALEELHGYWPALRAELGSELLAESREQYLRYALQAWDAAAQGDGIRNPVRAVQALDVLCVLFDEA